MGAKGAVEIIFRGKDVAEREKEYTKLFCNPLVSEYYKSVLHWQRIGGEDAPFFTPLLVRTLKRGVTLAKYWRRRCTFFFSPPCTNIKTRCLKKNLNAPRPSEHPSVWGKKCQNV